MHTRVCARVCVCVCDVYACGAFEPFGIAKSDMLSLLLFRSRFISIRCFRGPKTVSHDNEECGSLSLHCQKRLMIAHKPFLSIVLFQEDRILITDHDFLRIPLCGTFLVMSMQHTTAILDTTQGPS